jgi:hypothetical protein
VVHAGFGVWFTLLLRSICDHILLTFEEDRNNSFRSQKICVTLSLQRTFVLFALLPFHLYFFWVSDLDIFVSTYSPVRRSLLDIQNLNADHYSLCIKPSKCPLNFTPPTAPPPRHDPSSAPKDLSPILSTLLPLPLLRVLLHLLLTCSSAMLGSLVFCGFSDAPEIRDWMNGLPSDALPPSVP